jgi:hypothetical protein
MEVKMEESVFIEIENIKDEINNIINELNDIQFLTYSKFQGIGNEKVSQIIQQKKEKVDKVFYILNNLDTTDLVEEFLLMNSEQ